MPDDFVYLLQNLQDPGGVLFPWSGFEKRRYEERIERVFRGIEFDIERSGLWLQRWEKKPETLPAACFTQVDPIGYAGGIVARSSLIVIGLVLSL